MGKRPRCFAGDMDDDEIVPSRAKALEGQPSGMELLVNASDKSDVHLVMKKGDTAKYHFRVADEYNINFRVYFEVEKNSEGVEEQPEKEVIEVSPEERIKTKDE